MSNILATLMVKLGVDSATLRDGFKKAQLSSKSFAKGVEKNSKIAAKALAGLTVAATAAAGALAFTSIKGGLARIDLLAKSADKLGVTTKQLAGLQQAAAITGVQLNQLDKALIKQTKTVGDANNGLETYARHYRKLGLDTQELAKLNPAEQFKVIADALDNVGNQTERVTILTDIYGARNTALINTLKLGSKGLNEFESEAEKLGLAVSRIDAAKVEAANDAIQRAGKSIEGLQNKLTVAAAPFLEVLADEFTDAVLGAGDLNSKLAEMAGVAHTAFNVIKQGIEGGLIAPFLTAEFQLNKFYRSIAKLQAKVGVAGAQDEADKLTIELGRQAAKIREMTDGWGDWAKLVEDGEKFTARISKNAKEISDAAIEAANAESEANSKKTELAGFDRKGFDLTENITDNGYDFAQKYEEEFARRRQNMVTIALDAAQAQADGELAIQKVLDEQKISGQAITDYALMQMAIEQATAKVNAAFEAEQAAKGELGLAITGEQALELEKAIGDESIRIATDIANKRAAIAAEEAATLEKYNVLTFNGKANSLSAILGLTSSFNKKSNKLQKAALIASKAIAIKDSVIAISSGVAQALANPYPANLGFAAQVAAAGASLMGTLNSVGVGGGSGSAPGISSAPGGYSPATPDLSSEAEGVRNASNVTVQFNGDLVGMDDYTRNKVIGAIQEAVTERDIILVDSNSRNGQELAGVYA